LSKSDTPKYELLTVKTELLEPNDWNVNTQDDATFNRLREELRTVGVIAPIQVTRKPDGKYRILGGEHRWKAAMMEGIDEVPVIVLIDKKFEDDDLCKLVSVRVNMLHGKVDVEKFAKLHTEMANKYGADALQGLFGFTDAKGYQKLLAGVSKGLGGVSKELKKQFDENAKEAKTVEELTSILNELFAKYGNTMDQSFMVFTHGKKEHIYIAMDMKMRAAMQKVVEYCKLTKEDINTVLAPVTDRYMKECEAKMSEAFGDSKSKDPNKIN